MSEFFNLKCFETKLKGKYWEFKKVNNCNVVNLIPKHSRMFQVLCCVDIHTCAVFRHFSTKRFTVSRQRTTSNFEHSIYLFNFHYFDREGRLMPGFALVGRTLEHGVVYPAVRRQHQQTAYASAVYHVQELDAYFASIPKNRCFQTVRYKTTYATLLKTVDSSAVVNNHHSCSAKNSRVLT